MATGTPVSPIRRVANRVSSDGKSETFWSPMTTRASPRNSARVPMVTASDDSPSRVISSPLNAPHRAPTATQMVMTTQMLRSVSRHSTPMTALARPAVLATERSISPVMMMSVIGMASSRTGMTPTRRKPSVTVEAKLTMIPEARATTRTRAAKRPTSGR